MPFAQADDGTRIAYESHGIGSLKVLVLHGWGGSASYWRDLMSHLSLEGLQSLRRAIGVTAIQTSLQQVTRWINSPTMCSRLPMPREYDDSCLSVSA